MGGFGEVLELRRWLRNNGHAVRSLDEVLLDEIEPYVALERERVRVLQSPDARGVTHAGSSPYLPPDAA